MKATTKVISFDFEFQYSLRGQFATETAIVVAEPGYDKQAVFHKMRAAVTSASKGVMDWNAKRQAKDKAETTEQVSDGAVPEIDALELLRFGFAPEEYIEFVDYVQKALLRSPSLAWVGANTEQPFQDRIALNDEIMKSIGNAGGMPAIETIVSEFASFFLGGRASKTHSLPTEQTPGSPSSFEPLATATEASPILRRPRSGR